MTDEPRMGYTDSEDTTTKKEDYSKIPPLFYSQKRRNILFYTGLVMSILLVLLFVFLPTLFALLSVMWPNIFHGDTAVDQLNKNVNSLIGIISLLVGICSILYAYHSNRLMNIQSQKQQNFLVSLCDDTKKAFSTLDDLSKTSRSFFSKFDREFDVRYKKPSEGNDANEEPT